jgi:hypothetical protein
MKDETLKQLGRFALDCNFLDEFISHLATDVLGCAEWDVAQLLTREWTTGRKLEQLRDVSKKLAEIYVGTTPLYETLSAQIGITRELVNQRNAVIHGTRKFSLDKEPIAQLRTHTVTLNPAALSNLVQKIDDVYDKLGTAYLDFMNAVHVAREKQQAALKL